MCIVKSNLAYNCFYTSLEVVSKRSDFPTWSLHEIGNFYDLKFYINIWTIQVPSMSVIDGTHYRHYKAGIQSYRVEP